MDIIESFLGQRDKFLKQLIELMSMGDGHLGRMRGAKQCIELTSRNDGPIPWFLYRADFRARQFEKADINKRIAVKVIQPAQTEWVAPIILKTK